MSALGLRGLAPRSFEAALEQSEKSPIVATKGFMQSLYMMTLTRACRGFA